jgi:hypothetical protein
VDTPCHTGLIIDDGFTVYVKMIIEKQPDLINLLYEYQSPLGRAYLAGAKKNVELLKDAYDVVAAVDVVSFFLMVKGECHGQADHVKKQHY